MNIVLIGHKHAGKSTIGRLLADSLEREFIDTDYLLLREYQAENIAQLYQRLGEQQFRQAETQIVEQLSTNGAVIALGGGTPIFNPEQINKLGYVMYLYLDQHSCYQKHLQYQKPAYFQQTPTQEQFMAHYWARHQIYQQLSDKVIDVSYSKISDIVGQCNEQHLW